MSLRIVPGFAIISITVTILLFMCFRRPRQFGLTPGHSLYNSKSTNPPPNVDTNSEIGRAANGTLGFEKVISLSLKERTDRRDVIALQSSLTGFYVEFMDGVKSHDVTDKALPVGMDRKLLKEEYIGSWRAHMNAVRSFVIPNYISVFSSPSDTEPGSVLDNKLSSVLIIEDDIDWDIRIRSQMQMLAKGVRTLENIPIAQPQFSPYGDDWDIIWPGHCGEVLPLDDDRRYLIYNDETTAPKACQPWLQALADHPEGKRIIHKTGAPICTFAYAVSARGAQKILAALGTKGTSLNFDTSLAYFCRDNILEAQCYSIQPMLFYHHRPAGLESKDSDLVDNKGNSNTRETGFTDNIVWSTRLNIEKLIIGATDYILQW